MTGREMARTIDILNEYAPGDEHEWETEFAWLIEHHAPRLRALSYSVQQRGFLSPVLLGNDGRVWDGHHRLYVATVLGYPEVPVAHVGRS